MFRRADTILARPPCLEGQTHSEAHPADGSGFNDCVDVNAGKGGSLDFS